MNEITKAWIMYGIELAVGGEYSTATFSAKEVIDLVERVLTEVTGNEGESHSK